MGSERWLITGAGGQLGGHVVRQLATQPQAPVLLTLTGRNPTGTPGVAEQQIDLGDLDGLRACVVSFAPTHIVHLGALTAVGECHARPADAERINVAATRVLAEAAPAARFVFSSTDMVFAGDRAPYRESDPPTPLSCYGRTKLAAEQVLAGFERTLIVRVPLMYGRPVSPRQTTFTTQLAALRAGAPLRLFTDEFRTPVWLADAARALCALARSDLTGLMHLAGPERLSRYELVARCAALMGVERPRLVASSRLDVAAAEPRPADLSLDGTRFNALFPDLVPGPVRAAALEDV